MFTFYLARTASPRQRGIKGTSNEKNEEHCRVTPATSIWLQNDVLLNERKNIQKPYRAGITEAESNKCLYTAVNSVTFGGQANSLFTIKAGADVQAKAPNIKLLPGFKVEAGAHFKATPSPVVNGLKSFVENTSLTKQQPIVSYLTPSQYNNKVFDYNNHEFSVQGKTTILKGGVSIYPNPAKDELFVVCNDSCVKMMTVTLANVLGVTVKTTTLDARSKQAIDISIFTSGIYFVHVFCNNKSYSFKLIKE